MSHPTRPRRVLVLGLVAAAVVALGGCDLAGAANTAPAPVKGGTLYVNVAGGIDILDPQRTYSATEMDVLRLTTRTLTTYRSDPGESASEIVPDLATDTGRPSENNTVWRYTLKPNIKWQGGELVTCDQVKYGIERRFSPLMDEGAAYPIQYLQDNATPYRGPWLDNDNNGKGLESIKCIDEKNIQFTLKRPVGDFGYTLAMSVFAPVPKEKDTKEKYSDLPYSNGPYKITARDDKQIVMERNNFWSESNDQVRKAYPDKYVFTFDADEGGTVTNSLIEDQGIARNTIMLDANVAPNFIQQVVNDPQLSARTISGPTDSVRYLAINTRVQPDLACRQALIYAFNKRKWRAVNGGAATGDYATTFIPPNIKAHKDFDLYDSLSNPEGNPDKAIALMDAEAKAGRPCKSTIQVAYRDTPLYRRLVATVVEAYQLAGVQVIPKPLKASTYYNSGIGDPANKFDMMVAGWVPDWANGSAILPPNFSGSVIPPLDPITGHATGNVNFAMLNDPKINAQLTAALAETDPQRQYALWGDLDQQIQALAVTVTVLNEKGIRMAGTNVLGGFIHPAFGQPDLCSLGLAQP